MATAASPSAAVSAGRRTATLLSWQADNRGLRIGPGAESYLEIHENFNAGWSATMNGRSLPPVRLDGWQQAFIVPAGPGGMIRLRYGPATVYHAGLVASALALLALVLLASGLGRRRSRRFRWRMAAGTGPPAGSPPSRPSPWPANGQPLGPPRESSPGPPRESSPGPPRIGSESRRRPWAARAARTTAVFVPLAVVIGLAGGPAAVVVPVLACLDWRRPRWLPRVAFGAMLAAGVVTASASSRTALGSGAFGSLAQACALVALTAALLPEVAREAAGPSVPPAGDAEGTS